MNNEEIDYWLRYFSNHNHGFMSEDGKKITLFKMFQELKKLQQENAQLKDKLNKIRGLLNEPIFEYDNIPCNIENEIIQLKDILKEN